LVILFDFLDRNGPRIGIEWIYFQSYGKLF